MKVLKLLKFMLDNELYYKNELIEAIEEIEAIIKDKDVAQQIFIIQDLKHKKEIKELKVKFIEDVASLTKEFL